MTLNGASFQDYLRDEIRHCVTKLRSLDEVEDSVQIAYYTGLLNAFMCAEDEHRIRWCGRVKIDN